MARPYTPLAFANEFIVKSAGQGLEHMKLQKLTYMCYGWWLVKHDNPIIDEQPQVWQHGPVFYSLYFILNTFGHRKIRYVQSRMFGDSADRVNDDDDGVHDLIDWVWMKYGERSAFYLSDLTHKPGSPWHQVVEEYDYRVPRNTSIPVETIQSHFREIAADRGFSL